MKHFISRSVAFVFITLLLANGGCDLRDSNNFSSTRNQNFNLDWNFASGDHLGAEVSDFDDSDWSVLDLPHDWSIEDLVIQDSVQIGPFSKNSVGAISTGFTVGGTGWYRKQFAIDPADAGKIAFLHFDGIYMESEVWINGHHAGFHPNGYTPFYYNITPYLTSDGEMNSVAVKVINQGENSRWYSGSGIYRSVQLSLVNPVHIDPWGVAISTKAVEAGTASISVGVAVSNTTGKTMNLTLRTKLVSNNGEVSESFTNDLDLLPEGRKEVLQLIVVENPELWSIETPNLYKAEIQLLQNDQLVDTYSTHFGIRTIEFTADRGFLLNGKEVLMKGACMHHDNGLLGAAAFDRAESRRVEIMKSNGYNAIRTSHNPPSKAFLDACDRIGMLVIDESFDMWVHPKKSNDYHRYFEEWWQEDLRTMILRDRNHPSVIIWSIGNEIYERGDPSGLSIAEDLIAFVHELDSTRPVTQAICHFWEHPDKDWTYAQPAFEMLDISSYNYQWAQYEPDHYDFPKRVMLGSESFAMEAFENWEQVKKNPWVVGDFVWTGMDYIGEAAIGHSYYASNNEAFDKGWPWFNAWCGDIDIIGNKKPQSHYRDVVWGESNLEVLVHTPIPQGKKELMSNWGWPDEQLSWNWEGYEGVPLTVSVYSTQPAVRLYLNDNLIGEKEIKASDKLTTTFYVPYEKGELKAVAVNNGAVIQTKSIITAGSPSRIILNAEKAELKGLRGDLAYVQVTVEDEVGIVDPNAAIPLSLSIEGPAKLMAAGNSSPNNVASFQRSEFKTFRGKGLIILQLTGEAADIKLTVKSKDLQTATVKITVL